MVRMTLREAAAAGLLMAASAKAQTIITTVTELNATVLTLIPLATIQYETTITTDSCPTGGVIYSTVTDTVTSCPPEVTDCPYGKVTTTVVPCEASPVFAPISFTNNVYTVTECPETVTDCPYGAVSTETVPCSPTVVSWSTVPATWESTAASETPAAAPAAGGTGSETAAAATGGSGESATVATVATGSETSPAVVTAGAASFGGNAAAAAGGLLALFALF